MLKSTRRFFLLVTGHAVRLLEPKKSSKIFLGAGLHGACRMCVSIERSLLSLLAIKESTISDGTGGSTRSTRFVLGRDDSRNREGKSRVEMTSCKTEEGGDIG